MRLNESRDSFNVLYAKKVIMRLAKNLLRGDLENNSQRRLKNHTIKWSAQELNRAACFASLRRDVDINYAS